MTKRRFETILQRLVAMTALAMAAAACAEPARVVLYEERHGVAAVNPAPSPPETRTVVRAPSPSPRPVRRAPVPATPILPATVHTVQPGDTVYTVALRHEVPIRTLIERNSLQAPYVLRPGQVLQLPKPRRHVVRAGETIYRISRAYDVAQNRLVQVNDIEPPYIIVVGQVLRLPGSVEPFRSEEDATPMRPSPPAVRAARKPTPGRPRPGRKPLLTAEPSRQLARAVPAAVPKPPPLTSREFLLPVRGRVLSAFGPKGRGLRNDGVNIAAPRGAPVRAAQSGIVVYSGNALLGFGNMILLRHANGYMTAYAHNDALSVKRGDTVRRGQVIATIGSTGNVAAPQLHFEIRKGKRAVDPAKFLPALTAAS